MEHRPIPVRVGDPAKPLGAGSDGPIHAADRRLWHPCWNRGWPGPVPYVQPCDSRALASDAPQLRPRPAVSVSPMARQPAGAAGDRGKECAVCAAVASVCRTVDRHAATRMRGSAAVLVGVGLGRQTGGLPGLLQCASGPCVVGRADARPDTKGCREIASYAPRQHQRLRSCWAGGRWRFVGPVRGGPARRFRCQRPGHSRMRTR